jgi:hypothetical protein
MRTWMFLAKGVAVACLAMPLAGLAADRLSVAISQSMDDARAGRPYVTVTIANQSKSPVWILPAQTPLHLDEGRGTGRWFEFLADEKGSPKFVGRQMLLREPPASSYLKLEPGASRQAMVDLSVDYAFPTDGTYAVRTSIGSYGHIPTTKADDTGDVVLTSSEPVEVRVSTAYLSPLAPFADSVVPCTDEQQTQIGQAYFKATNQVGLQEMLLGLAYYYDPVDPAFPDKPRRKHMRRDSKYVYWLGEWDDDAPQPPEDGADDTDNAKVDATLHAMHVRFQDRFPIVCDLCPASDPATRGWTDGAGAVHLCPENFRDPIVGGISSQTGTLIHEASHIVDDKGPATVDLPNVTSRAQAHSLERPKAVISALNYEFWIMNVPLGRSSGLTEPE